ncbi:unnamed protein product [Penicillium olsonii]|nr:unnamed protein product [Penicillium olsonii]
MLEARLFHQFMTSTFHTISQDGLSANHLSVNVPGLATSYIYLLDGLHAISALHIASIEENRGHWLDVGLRYQSQACSGLVKALAGITAQEYEPAFFTSIFIMVFAMGYRVISSDRPPDPISLVAEIRTLISGPALLFNRIVEDGLMTQLENWVQVYDTERTPSDETPTQCNTPTALEDDFDIPMHLHAYVKLGVISGLPRV